jgi:glutathione peroxidase
MTVYDFQATSLDGKSVDLSAYRGKVLLIVNTASECGFTPQYKGLEQVYELLRDRGLVVLGFPCNQFGKQEPGTEADIGAFCEKNYGVSFPMFAKIDVNGDNAHPLYKYLKEQAPGVLGTEGIKWNFTKFLVNKDGKVVERYAPQTKPEEIAGDIEKLLGD